MTTKTLLIAACYVVAVILFALVGFDVVNEDKYDLTNVGLMFTALGLLIGVVWAG